MKIFMQIYWNFSSMDKPTIQQHPPWTWLACKIRTGLLTTHPLTRGCWQASPSPLSPKYSNFAPYPWFSSQSVNFSILLLEYSGLLCISSLQTQVVILCTAQTITQKSNSTIIYTSPQSGFLLKCSGVTLQSMSNTSSLRKKCLNVACQLLLSFWPKIRALTPANKQVTYPQSL